MKLSPGKRWPAESLHCRRNERAAQTLSFDARAHRGHRANALRAGTRVTDPRPGAICLVKSVRLRTRSPLASQHLTTIMKSVFWPVGARSRQFCHQNQCRGIQCPCCLVAGRPIRWAMPPAWRRLAQSRTSPEAQLHHHGEAPPAIPPRALTHRQDPCSRASPELQLLRSPVVSTANQSSPLVGQKCRREVRERVGKVTAWGKK